MALPNPIHMSVLVKHIEIAHHGQKRSNGDPYFVHLKRVAHLSEKYKDEEVTAAAWAHDVVEDGHLTMDELNRILIQAGFLAMARHRILEAVGLLTHVKPKEPGYDKREEYLSYVKKLSTNRIARLVKMCDLCDNLTEVPARAKTSYYIESLVILTELNKK